MNYELINKEAQKFAQAYKHKIAAETGFYHGAIWADEHPVNPWISVNDKRKPQKDGKAFIGAVADEKDGSEIILLGIFYRDEDGYYDENGTKSDELEDICDYWMPIPELSKGGEQ